MPFQLKNLKNQTSVKLYTMGEEIAHSVTHGIGTGLSLVGSTLLVVLAVLYGNVYQVVSFSIYGATLIFMYLASTLYHSFQHPRVKQVFQRIDHAAIFLLIAGTYTPFLLVSLRGWVGWGLLVLIWGLALCGVGFKTLFIHRFQNLSVIAYILMGWLGVVVFKDLLAHIPVGGLVWLALGGVMYTVGVIFYAWTRVRYTHAIWHIFVLGGSACHYFAVLLYLAPVS